MATYLLLRDNKESGPFTMDDLLNFGLKPYDLVWIQGKSAAWRYPSEVEELKPYAPIVEEQPFDRFYKKNTEDKKEEPTVANEQMRYAPVPKNEELKFTPKKSVFVTLPNQKQVTVQRAVEPAPETPAPSTVTPVISITENPPVAEIKYSQPLDEIKEMYVKTLQQRKNKIAKKGVWLKMLRKTAVFGGLIILGLLAGFIIRSKSGKEDKNDKQMMQASSASIANPVKKLSPIEALPGDDHPTGNVQSNGQGLSKKENDVIKTNEEPTTIRIRKETMMIVPKRKEKFDTGQFTPASETNAITGERSRKIRTTDTGAEEKEKEVVLKTNKNSLHDLVSVVSNDYKRVAFGGIRDLYLTVKNNSKYELDNVIVQLQYLKPSEEPLRTENINFKSIAPNASSTIRVPDTNRGIKVSYKIINIDSKQNSNAVAGM